MLGKAIREWLTGPGVGCRGSRLNQGYLHSDNTAFNPSGGHQPWALVVLEIAGDQIVAWNALQAGSIAVVGAGAG
jgi:RNA polymerase sigma-70 factor, ECF subfamily